VKDVLQYRNSLTASAIVLVFFMIIRSIFSHYSLEQRKLKIKRDALEKNKSTIEDWAKLEKEYEALKENFLQGDTLIFKKAVEEKAQSQSIDITSLTISREEKDYYWEAVMNLEAVCLYEDFKDFMNSLEEKNIEVQQLDIAGTDTEQIKVKVSLKGIIVK